MPITADMRWSCGRVICRGAHMRLMTVSSGDLWSTWTPALSGTPIWPTSAAGSETARATTSFMGWRERSESVARRSAMNRSRSNMAGLLVERNGPLYHFAGGLGGTLTRSATNFVSTGASRMTAIMRTVCMAITKETSQSVEAAMMAIESEPPGLVAR